MNYSYTVLDYRRSTQTFTILVKTDDTSVTRPEIKFSFGYSESTITEEKFQSIVKRLIQDNFYYEWKDESAPNAIPSGVLDLVGKTYTEAYDYTNKIWEPPQEEVISEAD